MDTEKATDYTKDEFYKEIVISVFGVFNVSRLADNPPPVPYIDINHLKQIYYNKDSEYSQKYPLLWVLRELNEQITNLPLVTNKSIITNLTNLIADAKKDYIIYNKPENILTMLEQSRVSFKVGDRLKEIIEEIDIHNAASTIGTLEFLDQVAKFNSVNNLCYKNTVDGTTPYLDDKDLDLDSRIVKSEYAKYVANAAPI
jgi:DNA polymerase/3'-5' exonuclease PolX